MRAGLSSLPLKRYSALSLGNLLYVTTAFWHKDRSNILVIILLPIFCHVDFPEAEKVFEELVKENPHRLDSLDVFSNVLFTTGRRARLSFLAHSCAMTDNYRPETCCVIGKRQMNDNKTMNACLWLIYL